MKLVVVSPEGDRADEIALLDALFRAGLERYHVRKPHASLADLDRWIAQVPSRWRPRLFLHQHHELVDRCRLGGRHWRDVAGSEAGRGGAGHARADDGNRASGLTSRSCHDLAAMRAALGAYDAVFFGPVFPSISKPGYQPRDAGVGEALGAILHTRTAAERRTSVIAIGGITAATAPRAAALGFDGVAVLGAIWQSDDPVRALQELLTACDRAGQRDRRGPGLAVGSGLAPAELGRAAVKNARP